MPVLTLFLVWACLWRGDTSGAARFDGESLEAATLAERARADLNRLGGRATRSQALTPTEARVAELAATGLSNRQIA